VNRAARENAAAAGKAETVRKGAEGAEKTRSAPGASALPLRGDALAEHLVRAAAGAARAELERGTPPRDCARAFLIVLGTTLDPSSALRKHPLVFPLVGTIETEEEARSRSSAAAGATLRGRGDLLQHFAVAAALTAAAGEAPAWAASLQKETIDATLKDGGNGTGFSFADLAADRAGIELAGRLLALAAAPPPRGREEVERTLDRLARDFRGSDYLPDPAGYLRDPTESLGWKDFLARFGSLTDSRFTERIRSIREEVLRSPGFSTLR